MTEPIFAGDDEGAQPEDGGGAYQPLEERMPLDEPVPDEPAAEGEPPAWEPEPTEAPEPIEEPEPAEAPEPAAEPEPTQDALFTAEEPSLPAETPDDTVTSFGAPPDDLDAIRADLTGQEAPEEPPAEAAETSAEVDGTEQAAALGGGIAAAAADAAEEEATESLVEAGVPEGSDDEPDAVEALLDAEAGEGLLEPAPKDRTLSLPFWIYDAVWLVFVVAMVFVLRDAAVAGALDQSSAYPLFVLIGLVLTVVGPLLAIVVWLVARTHVEREDRRGLLAISLLRGSLATFAGVAMWWAGLVLLNYFKTGRFF